MKVSIITVSYNSENSIARTIESVLSQTYEELEYLIIDGKSTDRTVQTAEKYREAFQQKGIEYRIISEQDFGIYDAMNKGIRLATGEIIGMINSDDWYEPYAVEYAVRYYQKQPYDLFYADVRIISAQGSFIKHSKNSRWVTSRYWNHPTTFIPKHIYDRFSYKNETIHDDWDLILRIRKEVPDCRITVRNEVLANFSRNGVSHEKSFRRALERARIKYRIYRNNGYSRLYAVECYVMEAAKLLI